MGYKELLDMYEELDNENEKLVDIANMMSDDFFIHLNDTLAFLTSSQDIIFEHGTEENKKHLQYLVENTLSILEKLGVEIEEETAETESDDEDSLGEVSAIHNVQDLQNFMKRIQNDDE